MKGTETTDNVMKTHTRQGRGFSKSHTKDRKDEDVTLQMWNKRTQSKKVLQEGVVQPL